MVGTFRSMALCLVLAAVGVTSASQTQPLGTPEKRVAKQSGSLGAQESTRSKEDKTATPNVTVLVKQEQPSGKKPNENQAAEEENTRIQKRLANLTTWLVVAAFLTCGVLIWQAVETRRAVEATSRAAEAAKTSAEAAIAAERAWVIAELVPLCTKFSDGKWYRRVADNWAQLSDIEILEGYFRMHTLRFTNMGRTPAHILNYQITYSCLGEGVTTLSGGAISKQVSIRTFDYLLRGSDSVEVPEAVDVDSYMAQYIEGIRQLKNTAVFHGWVQYQHVFNSSEILEEPFCYSFKSSDDSLVRIPQSKSDKQKQTAN